MSVNSTSRVPCAACLGGLGHVLGLALVAAIVEQDQQVLAAEVVELVGEQGAVVEQSALRAQQAQMGDQVAGEETAEASAVAVHAQAAVEQPVGEALDVIGAGQAEGLLQALASLVEVARPGVVAAHPLAAFGEQGARRAQAVVDVGQQRFLEVAVAGEAELFHQAHDRWVADSGVPGQARHRTEAEARVVIEQGTHHLALRGRQFGGRGGQALF